MENIQRLSRRFCWVIRAFIFILPITTIVYWSCFSLFQTWGVQVSNTSLALMIPGSQNQTFALCANLLPIINIMVGLAYLHQLFENFAQGLIFSMRNVKIYRNIGWTLLCLAVTENIFESLVTWAMTASTHGGPRMVSIGYDSAQVIYIVIASLILTTAHVMREAYELDQDARFTI